MSTYSSEYKTILDEACKQILVLREQAGEIQKESKESFESNEITKRVQIIQDKLDKDEAITSTEAGVLGVLIKQIIVPSISRQAFQYQKLLQLLEFTVVPDLQKISQNYSDESLKSLTSQI